MGLLHGARTHEAHHGRGGAHGEAAYAEGLADGAVADVGVGVFFGISGEIEPLGREHGGLEPLVAQRAHLDAEVGAVAAHGSDHRAVLDVLHRVHGGLAGGHGEIEEELVVAGDEAHHPLQVRPVLHHLGEGGGHLAHKEGGGGYVALVHLVSHGQRLGYHDLEGDGARSRPGPPSWRGPARSPST